MMTKERQRPNVTSKWHFIWICALILSFSYELPLWFVTSYDRINPRLHDVVLAIGVVTVLPFFRRGYRMPQIFRIWAKIVVVFAFCAFVWALMFLPWEYGRFSLFFAAKYALGLLVIYMAIKYPLNERQKEIVHYLVVAGGVFVALYSVWQYFHGVSEFQLNENQVLTIQKGVILGPLSNTYFHIGMFSTLSFAMAMALVPKMKGMLKKIIFLGIALLVGWPGYACGSRASLIGVSIVFMVYLFLHYRFFVSFVGLVVVIVAGLRFDDSELRSFTERTQSSSLGFQRLVSTERHEKNSVLNRIFVDFSPEMYLWEGISIPFIGAGFYVAPFVEDHGFLRYRVGYGVHNAYLFPLEQGGLIAFGLFLYFLACVIYRVIRMVRAPSAIDRRFAFGQLYFLAALLPVAIAGQVFWRGFETGNLNTFILVLFVFSSRASVDLTSQREWDAMPTSKGQGGIPDNQSIPMPA